MKKHVLLLLFALSVSVSAQAQTISGYVFDEKTKEPLSSVNVYLDGTSFMTITTDAGYFDLPIKQRLNTKLVISHIGYEHKIIENPYDVEIGNVYLKEKFNIVGEITVSASRYTREVLLKAFKKQFLGGTYAGKTCIILNEDAINLSFSSDEKKLKASSSSPLIIENRYLGYELQFDLHDFYVLYSTASLDEKKVEQVYFKGASFYKDKAGRDKRTLKRRRDVYYGSSRHFFKSVIENTLDDSEFDLQPNMGFGKVSQTTCFELKEKSKDMQLVRVIVDPDALPKGRLQSEPARLQIKVMFRKRLLSEIIFYCNEFKVDPAGLTDNIDRIMYLGYMGDQRAADLLPFDYEP